MIHVARSLAEVGAEERLATFRQLSAPYEARARRQFTHLMSAEHERKYGVRRVGGAAPALQTTLSSLKASVTKNTFTTFATIIGDDNRGPFAVDYFNTPGAGWLIEAMGIIGVAAATTPTVQFRMAYGTTLAAISTMLAQTGVLTSISGMANVPWYAKVMGVVKQASGATSTMLVTGWVLSQIVIAAANNIVNWMSNATPPTAVVTDLSSSVYLDLQAQWGTSNVANSIRTDTYLLQSQWS